MDPALREIVKELCEFLAMRYMDDIGYTPSGLAEIIQRLRTL